MSSHYIYIVCDKCNKMVPLYTGQIETEEFDDVDWEGEAIHVSKCKDCKKAEL